MQANLITAALIQSGIRDVQIDLIKRFRRTFSVSVSSRWKQFPCFV